MNRKLKIGILSVDERHFIRKMWESVAENFPGQIDFIYETPFVNRYFSFLSQASLAAIVYGWRLMTLLPREAYTRTLKIFGIHSSGGLKELAKTANSYYHYEPKFSNAKLSKYLKIRQPDILLCQVPNLINGKVLNLPTYGCWNKHFGKLPEQRGSANFLYSLSSGDSDLNYSIYMMGEKYDCGLLLHSGSIKFESRMSIYDNFCVLNESAIDGLIESVKQVEREGLPTGPMVGEDFPAYRLPNPLDAFSMLMKIKKRSLSRKHK